MDLIRSDRSVYGFFHAFCRDFVNLTHIRQATPAWLGRPRLMMIAAADDDGGRDARDTRARTDGRTDVRTYARARRISHARVDEGDEGDRDASRVEARRRSTRNDRARANDDDDDARGGGER